MADFKTTVLSTLQNGKNVIEQIDALKKTGTDYSINADRTDRTINKYHNDNLKLRVNEIIEVNKDVKTFRLVSDDCMLPVFKSGQYLNIFTVIEGVRTSRPYSISSSSKQRAYYELTIARVPNGFVSNFMLNEVKLNDVFEASNPAGEFVFNPIFHSDKSVFIAGGSGITPFISMLSEALDKGQKRSIKLIYGCKDYASVLFLDLLQEYASKHSNFSFDLVLTNKDEKVVTEVGFINKDIISKLVQDIDDSTFYICGPQIMNDFVVKQLEELKVKSRWIRREMFGSSPNIVTENGWPTELNGSEVFTLTINKDIKVKCNANESLLVALERNKVRVNVCCRSGECSLCKVQLVAGNVFLSKGSLLRHSDEKFGFIHSCKAFPISDLEIII